MDVVGDDPRPAVDDDVAAGFDPLHDASLDLHVQQVVGAAVDLVIHQVQRVVGDVRSEGLA